MKTACISYALGILLSFGSVADDNVSIRIGVQASGTLDWELAELRREPSASETGFELTIQRLANAEAGKIALQSGAVDLIVSDWIWVSRMRSIGTDLAFYPYSSSSGALVVPNDSTIRSITDLPGKRLGIAGGELDKNWLLLQALAKQTKIDLNADASKIFGAPPLINEQLKQKRIDAALNYWHFAARLETEGYRRVIDGKGLLTGLGIEQIVPTLGYVFKRSWASSRKNAINSFFKASRQAKERLCTQDEAWRTAVPMSEAEDAQLRQMLRQRYCEGLVTQWGEEEWRAADRIYALLRTVSGNRLTGQSQRLQPGTFWSIDE